MGAFKGWQSIYVNQLFAKFPNINFASFPSTFMVGILDNVRAAYSVRLVNAFYRGPCMRIRRSSDNNTLDVFFIGIDLDTQAIELFVGSDDAYVVIWYDQSNFAFHAINNTTSTQPQIVSAGTIITENSKPSLRFRTGLMRLPLRKFTSANNNWSFNIISSVDNIVGNNNNVIYTDGHGFNNNGTYLQNNRLVIARSSSSLSIIPPAAPINFTLFANAFNYTADNTIQSFFNGLIGNRISALIGGNTFTNGSNPNTMLGIYPATISPSSTVGLIGNCSEFIICIGTNNNTYSGMINQNQYYNIF